MTRILNKSTLPVVILIGLFAVFLLFGQLSKMGMSDVPTESFTQPTNALNWPKFETGHSSEYIMTLNGHTTVRRSSKLLSMNPLVERFLVSDYVMDINSSGAVDLDLKYKQVASDLDGGSTDSLDTLLGSSLKGTGNIHIAEDGTIKTSVLPDNLIRIPGITQKQFAVSQMYLSLPPEGFEVGGVWQTNYTTAIYSDKNAQGEEVGDAKYTLVGYENYQGCQCAKIEVELESQGSYSANGNLILTSETHAHGFIYFDQEQGWPFAQILDLTWIGSSKITETTVEFSLVQLPAQLSQ